MLRRASLQSVQAAVVQEVLPHGEALVQRRRLEDDAERRRTAPRRSARRRRRRGPAFRGALQRRADPEQRGLAAAVGPKQRHELPGATVERHVVEGDAAAVAVGEWLIESAAGNESWVRRLLVRGAERAAGYARLASISTQSTGR